MPLDPQAHALIASMVGVKPVEQMTVQEMRDGLEQRTLLTGGTPEPVAVQKAAANLRDAFQSARAEPVRQG